MRLRKLAPLALWAATLLQACSSLPPERRLVDDAVAAIVKHVPVHGARESFADMVKTIKAKARA